ncbi:OmpP1/FadL family transporter [Sphingomonas montanisoli]|uniref:Aromatic hydrocarbon degradation protein n=1 Tax=Sphingomonas montanisoli TaxID=2606412 RepID=A0A5D9CBC6_9SPHN|nr:outer membrane protein transport protein [Sphingomonas montanisoli]TZG27365.1 aromatic hydrocarbon degradation protein [Sphingomonas montanisoli]
MTTNTFRRAALLTATASATLLGAASANAAGFYLQEQSTKAVGRAFSGEGADQGAESMWWNPAAIGGNAKSSAYLSASAILPNSKVRNVNTLIRRPTNATFVPVGGNQVSEDPVKKGVLPSGGVAYRVNDQFAVGLAITSPYSFATNYDNNSWARYTADKTKLTTIDIQPTIAWAPLPEISVGVGLNLEHSDATLTNALPNVSAALPDGSQSLKGKGWDMGWSAGMQFRPSSFIDLGVSYKSSIKHKLKGDVTIAGLVGPLAASNLTTNAVATFRTPWQLVGSMRLHVTDKWTLNGTTTRVGWSKFDAIRLGAPLNTAIPENYRNTWSFAGGWDYDMSPQLTLRGGIQWDQTPTRNGERDARVPDGNRWNYALGASYKMNDMITLDAGGMYTSFDTSKIDRTTAAYAGTAAQTPILVNGSVKASAIVLSLGARASF